MDFNLSPKPAPPMKVQTVVPAGTVDGYTGPSLIKFCAGRTRQSAEEWEKRYADARCLYCGEYNHRVVECAAGKKAQTGKAVGVQQKVEKAGMSWLMIMSECMIWMNQCLRVLWKVGDVGKHRNSVMIFNSRGRIIYYNREMVWGVVMADNEVWLCG